MTEISVLTERLLHRAKPRLGRTSSEPQSNSELGVKRAYACGTGFTLVPSFDPSFQDLLESPESPDLPDR